MQWDQPTGTILCDICAEDFVVARLNADSKFYCEKCLDVKAQELMQTMHPSMVVFKPIQGNLASASKVRITTVKDSNWISI